MNNIDDPRLRLVQSNIIPDWTPFRTITITSLMSPVLLLVSLLGDLTSADTKADRLYDKTCKKLGILPVMPISKALKSGRDVSVTNRAMDALDMLSLTNALIVSSSHAHGCTCI